MGMDIHTDQTILKEKKEIVRKKKTKAEIERENRICKWLDIASDRCHWYGKNYQCSRCKPGNKYEPRVPKKKSSRIRLGGGDE